jgi:branched-chain amino acid transport system permease protein
MIVNVLIERIAYRRLRNAPRLAPLITAIGVSILLQTFAMMIWGRNPLPSRNCCRPTHQHRRRPDSPTQILLALALVHGGPGAAGGKTKMGRAMRATAENPAWPA